MDVASRKVLHWGKVRTENSKEVLEQLGVLLERLEGIVPGILHGDLGVFASGEVRKELLRRGIEPSTRDKRYKKFGNNVIERFNGLFKNTVLKELREKKETSLNGKDISEVIELGIRYYNEERVHGALGEVPEVVYMNMMDMEKGSIEKYGSGQA